MQDRQESQDQAVFRVFPESPVLRALMGYRDHKEYQDSLDHLDHRGNATAPNCEQFGAVTVIHLELELILSISTINSEIQKSKR